jgi:hypothetical protein
LPAGAFNQDPAFQKITALDLNNSSGLIHVASNVSCLPRWTLQTHLIMELHFCTQATVYMIKLVLVHLVAQPLGALAETPANADYVTALPLFAFTQPDRCVNA